ncbi:MAG: GNAT family N-acetyltransferase [Ilumatobacter sp.]|uniref:GNAT family N-acetyltransferase n=1 Tax=Ilumatobacter sp. TaxID=1967498 RepID=UPI00262B766C|nr:GNAT family N-acetyltransferase [Ilumatobacter sp.]MDJ0769235.1 GNAT family N-acetyltransferase [Ilumatobacter sp.]
MRMRRRSGAPDVEIIDLPDRHQHAYFVCLEEWSPEMEEGLELKRRWFELHRERGLRVKVAVTGDDRPVGMIQYLPIEHSPAEGEDLSMILCIWVHGHRKGAGNVQGGGIGARLLEAAEADARDHGALGMVAWGLHAPVWMKAAWFKQHGYVTADRRGARELVWKRFSDEATAPRWLVPQDPPERDPDTVDVTAFLSGWCPAANMVHDRARRAAAELGDEIRFRSFDTTDRATAVRFGRTDEVLVDGRPLQRAAPPSYAKVRRRLDRRRRRLQRRGRRAGAAP